MQFAMTLSPLFRTIFRRMRGKTQCQDIATKQQAQDMHPFQSRCVISFLTAGGEALRGRSSLSKLPGRLQDSSRFFEEALPA